MGAANIALEVERALELVKPYVEAIPDLEVRVAAGAAIMLISEGLKAATTAGLMTEEEGNAEQVRELVRSHMQAGWEAAIREKFGKP